MTNTTATQLIELDWNSPSVQVGKMFPWEEQSAEVTSAPTLAGAGDAGAQATQEQNVQFLDEAEGMQVGVASMQNPVMTADITPSVELADFLRRPVKIYGGSWLESSTVGVLATVQPWYQFFNDARIKYKLNNYAFIRCDLKIKVLINASPFYYGLGQVSYQPMPSLTPSTIVNDTGTRYLIPYSQRPHIWLYPSASEGGDLTLPFFYYKNMVNAQSASDMQNLGLLSILLYTTLQSANGATGSGVSIEIFAWAENVQLSGPSVGLAMQSGDDVKWEEQKGDEYGQGIISKPASAVASVAAQFKKVPIFKPFAVATEMGANLVSSVASMFGFTNVPVIADTMPLQPLAYPNFATTDVGFPAQKLTLDSKNELTVDPMTVGLPSEDELAITSLVSRESYLTQAAWSTSNNVDDVLFTSTVNPFLYDTDTSTYQKAYMTPMCMVSQLFQYWRGDVIFRFRFIVSRYHKGRVRISYDPAGYSSENINSDAVSTSVVHTQILDLGKDSDIEVRVPYQQAASWLVCHHNVTNANIQWTVNSAASWIMNPGLDNGAITVRVMTVLTAPVASSSVQMIVSVRGGDNLEFACPVDPPQTTSLFAPQCGEDMDVELTNVVSYKQHPHRPHTPRPLSRQAHILEQLDHASEEDKSFWREKWRALRRKKPWPPNEDPSTRPRYCQLKRWEQQSGKNEPVNEMSQEITAGNHESVSPDQRYRVNFGECVASLRNLMRRYTLSYVYFPQSSDTTDAIVLYKSIASKFPLYYGYDPNGIHTALGLISGTNKNFNFVSTAPYHWITPCFIAQRGSMNWSFNVDGQRPIASIRMVRKPDTSYSAASNQVIVSATGSESYNASLYQTSDAGPGCGGQAITNQSTQAGLNVVLPISPSTDGKILTRLACLRLPQQMDLTMIGLSLRCP